jgi:heme a synthase
MRRDPLRTFAWATVAVTVAVILWGAYVRASGSGAGCGSHWPTCQGAIVPHARSVATIIEYTHRATSGLSGLMVLAQLVWVLLALPKGHPARAGAAASMFFMVTEGAVGAGLVLLEHVALDRSVSRAGWTSLHLVNTFFLVAAVTCTAWWVSGGRAPRREEQGPAGTLLALGGVALVTTGVSGAVTALGDTLFPSSTLAAGMAADFSPAAHFLQQLRVIHPIAAVLTALFLLYARGPIAAGRGAEAGRFSRALAALLVSQLVLGVANFALQAPIAIQIVHLLLADLVWIVFVLFAAAVLGAEATSPASPPVPVGGTPTPRVSPAASRSPAPTR